MVSTRKRTYPFQVQLRRCRPKLAFADQMLNLDIWCTIARLLSLKDLANLASASKFLLSIFGDELVWKSLCLQKLGLPDSPELKRGFSWKELFRSAFDKRICNHYRQSKRCREFKRIGAFTMESGNAIVTGKLFKRASLFKSSKSRRNAFVFPNIKPGIWLADLYMRTCPKCDRKWCQGTMQVMEFRHLELSLNKGYENRNWTHKRLEVQTIKDCESASCGVFDYKRIRDQANEVIFNYDKWIPPKEELYPTGTSSQFGAAACSNLNKIQDVIVKFYIMTAGTEGPVVSIRITQQLP